MEKPGIYLGDVMQSDDIASVTITYRSGETTTVDLPQRTATTDPDWRLQIGSDIVGEFAVPRPGARRTTVNRHYVRVEWTEIHDTPESE